MKFTFESRQFAFDIATRPLYSIAAHTVCPAGIAIRVGWHVFTRPSGCGPYQWLDTRKPFDYEAHKAKYSEEYRTAHLLFK